MPEILASLTLVTDIFTLYGRESGIVGGAPHDRDAWMRAIPALRHDPADVAVGRTGRVARFGAANEHALG
jgi:hypothetical protein